MIERVRAAVLERWQELGLPGPLPRRLSFCLTDDGRGRAGRAIVRVFRADDPEPLLVAKIPRGGMARRRAEREHQTLRELEVTAPRLAGRRFPRALLLEDDGDRLFTVQSVVHGEALGESLEGAAGVDAVRRTFDEAKEWLGQLWRSTGLFESAEAVLWEPFLRDAHAELGNEGAGEMKREIEALVLAIEARRDASCLAAVSHGDFTAGHLLKGAGVAGAVDWEHARLRQFAWVDPIAFAMDVALRLGDGQGEEPSAAFQRAFVDDGVLRKLVTRFVEDCLTECGVAADVIPLAVPTLALSRARRAARLRSAFHPEARRWRDLVRSACAMIAC
jgi:hypothetical protein